MRIIRASEIGTYLYCQRAWWYLRQGVHSENVAELSTGSELHRRHGQAVMRAGLLRLLAYGLLMLALVLLTIHFVGQLI